MEIRVFQKNSLFELLKLKKEIGETKELNALIIKAEASMEAEDVAWVEKKIAELG
jgi:hypothetical protein